MSDPDPPVRPSAAAPTPEQVTASLAILPFRFLEAGARQVLREALEVVVLPPDQVLLGQGSTDDEQVWLLLQGQVAVIDHRRGPAPRTVSTIEQGHYFGERRPLFGQPRVFEIRSLSTVTAARFPGRLLLELLRQSTPFAVSLGTMLRDKQGLLRTFERFVAEVRHSAARGYLVIPRLVHLYMPLRPALHRGVGGSEIDFDALRYVVPRLPRGISEVLSLFLTDELPPAFPDPERAFPEVATPARRRAAYQLMPGKLLVRLRDGWTDLFDLVTCLCAYAVEARKIRARLKDPDRVAALIHGRSSDLPFDAAEQAHLEALWPGRVSETLRAMVTHHEDFAVHVYRRADNYDAAQAERWIAHVADCTARLLGCEPNALSDDFEVHVVSSNTHSVPNTLSPWLAEHGARIEAWGEAAHPELMSMPWPDPMDRVVALSREFFAAHPELEAERRVADEGDGVEVLTHTAFTGIEVQLFCLQRLAQRNWDPAVPSPSGHPGLLVNIDYAFGQQAEPIITALLSLFGRRIRSVSVLGKAGGLYGSRGDVLVASSFVEQETDALIEAGPSCDLHGLRQRLPGRRVLAGRLATVAGTLLQNDVLLRYYLNLWQCIGIEMEGSWYARRLQEAMRLGLLRADCDCRFLYYVSDLPLEHGESLSGSMGPFEGIPPLYAITRHVLTEVFSD